MTWGSELRAMPSNTPLPSKLNLWAVTIALLIVGNVVSAQEESAADAADAADAGVAATNESSQSDATDPTQSQADPGAVLDYEPSESISEDLSVSFPVDI